METFGLFLGKSLLVSGLLTLLYFAALRGKRLHQYNRFFLLSVFPVSLLLPLLHFHWFDMPQAFKGHLSPIPLFSSATATEAAEGITLQDNAQPFFSGQLILAAVAALISLALLLLLALRIVKVYRMRSRQTILQHEGVCLVLTDSTLAPFTFFNTLFWHSDIPLDGKAGQLIFLHELAHIRQGHTYDKIACQLLTCIFWFNPFYWIIQKELNMVHEFIADEYAVAPGDTEAFALMMLQSYHKGRFLVPEHHFFSSAIKRRLRMLQNRGLPSFTPLRKLIVLPCLTLIVLLFSFRMAKRSPLHGHPAAKTIIVMLDAGGNDEDQGSSASKDLYRKCVAFMKALAPAYNVSVQIKQHPEKGFVQPPSADVFVALYLGSKQAKGDVNVYVNGNDVFAKESNIYGGAVLDVMGVNGIIPGVEKTCIHKDMPCNCNASATQVNGLQDKHSSGIPEKSIQALSRANMPAILLVMGNRDNNVSRLQLNDESHLNDLCHSLLEGIVQGAIQRERSMAASMSGITASNSLLPAAEECKAQ